jgi:hypothetical protein
MQHLLRGLQLAAAKLAASRVAHSFLALIATALVIIFADLWQWSWLALLLLWAGVAALLSPVWSVVVFGGGLLISWALSQASTYKVALNGMPITTLDIKITAANPAVLWYLLGLPQWSRLLIILLMLSGFAYVVYRTTRHIELLSVFKLALWTSAVACLLILYEAKLTLTAHSRRISDVRVIVPTLFTQTANFTMRATLMPDMASTTSGIIRN